MLRPNGGYFDHLSINEFDTVVIAQNSGSTDAMEFIDRELAALDLF